MKTVLPAVASSQVSRVSSTALDAAKRVRRIATTEFMVIGDWIFYESEKGRQGTQMPSQLSPLVEMQ
jgi:hypothetical protein